jgi:hypothetical protein
MNKPLRSTFPKAQKLASDKLESISQNMQNLAYQKNSPLATKTSC